MLNKVNMEKDEGNEQKCSNKSPYRKWSFYGIKLNILTEIAKYKSVDDDDLTVSGKKNIVKTIIHQKIKSAEKKKNICSFKRIIVAYSALHLKKNSWKITDTILMNDRVNAHRNAIEISWWDFYLPRSRLLLLLCSRSHNCSHPTWFS